MLTLVWDVQECWLCYKEAAFRVRLMLGIGDSSYQVGSLLRRHAVRLEVASAAVRAVVINSPEMGLQYEDWPVRDYIPVADEEEWELLRLRQQLLSHFGERCVVEGLQGSTAGLCARLDELRRKTEGVALLILSGSILGKAAWKPLIRVHPEIRRPQASCCFCRRHTMSCCRCR